MSLSKWSEALTLPHSEHSAKLHQEWWLTFVVSLLWARLGFKHVLYLVLTTALKCGNYYPHFIDKSIEVQRDVTRFLSSPTNKLLNWDLTLACLASAHFSSSEIDPWHLFPFVSLDPSLEDMCGTECAQLGEDGQQPPRCTSTTSSQSEPAEQLRHHQGKSLASEDPKKKRAQKPSHMRRNIRWAVLWERGEGKE